MADLTLLQYALIALIFIWSGFVRSGLGFGGATLSLPLLLLVSDTPVVFLPIIGIHLLVFSSITVWQNHRKQSPADESGATTGGTVNWTYLRKVLLILLIPKLAGVVGLLTLPDALLSAMIFVIVGAYSVTYIRNIQLKSRSRLLDFIFLALGGYISGTSLVGAPLIIAVVAQYVNRHQLRDTLFVLWFVLVCIKLTAFVIAGVDLQLLPSLLLLPAAAIGHVIGLHVHDRLLTTPSQRFYQGLGWLLLITSTIGVVRVML